MVDGATGGNPHFYFLSPLVKQPNFSGVFNPNLTPAVEICKNTAQDAFGHCTSLLVRFQRGSDKSAQQIVIDGDHYVVHWQFTNYAVAEDVPFRIAVMIGDIQLGYIDLVKQGSVFRNQTTGQVVSRAAGGTLPLRFRIESGALCTTSSTECFEGMVGPAGGTFTVLGADGSRPAGTEFPQNALTETVTLIIEHIQSGECLPTDVPQYQGCYRFKTEPYVPQFELPVTVGICLLDASALPYFNDGQLRLWKWSENTGDPIEELDRVQITYLECPTLTSPSSSLLLGAARAGSWLLKPLASLLGPRDAHAMGVYEGGKLINFSRIGWVRPLSVEIRAGDGQSGPAGQPLPIQPKVRVTNKYGFTLMGVSGRIVNFTPSGDGLASPATATTDVAGEAATTWTLASTAGANTLLARTPTSRAIAPTPYQAEALFNATGSAPMTGVLWLPRIGSAWDGTSGFASAAINPQVVISDNGVTVATPAVTLNATGYSATMRVVDFQHPGTYRVAVKLNGQTLGYVDVSRGTASDKLYNVATGTIVADITVSQYFVISFRLLQ